MSIKLTHEFVYNYYSNEKYILNSMYKGNRYKDILKCPVGHNIEMFFNNFKHGNRCKVCYFNNRKLIHEDVYNYYKEYNYLMISIYKNCMTKDDIICSNGHEIKIRFNDFQQGYRCRICYELNNRGEGNPRYNPDRTRRIRSQYLSFDLKKLTILNDEPLYENYILSQQEARNSDNIHEKTKYTVDHIQPRIAFIDNDLDNLYGIAVIKELCNSRDNLRIIHQKDNGSKAAKYNQEEFINWFNQKLEKYNETSKNNIE